VDSLDGGRYAAGNFVKATEGRDQRGSIPGIYRLVRRELLIVPWGCSAIKSKWGD